jgi:mannitol-specific phosphotransferase system IIBC component
LPASAEAVIAHRSLVPRVKELAPRARVYAVDEFINSPVYEEIVTNISQSVRKG